MNKTTAQALAAQLLALADDQLILAHRNSEWIGHAPILEEDIALANIAQDELGHARLFYDLYVDISEDDPDRLVFFRDAGGWCNVQLVELPCGDWAFTMVRQFLFDAYEMTLLARLVDSTYPPLREVAAKIRNEEMYHYRHTSTWLKRLGLGTAESQRRTQAALKTLWAPAQQLFVTQPQDDALVQKGFLPDLAECQQAWSAVVRPFLEACDLTIPTVETPPAASRKEHTVHLPTLLAEMQEVARHDPEATW